MHHEVRAEMVGKVLEIGLQQGAPVSVGDVLLVVESMKMEIPVVAEVAGTVASLEVTPGSVVQAGDLMAVVDAGESGGA